MIQELFFGLEGPDLPRLVLTDAPGKALFEFPEGGLVGIFHDSFLGCSGHDRYSSLMGNKDYAGTRRRGKNRLPGDC